MDEDEAALHEQQAVLHLELAKLESVSPDSPEAVAARHEIETIIATLDILYPNTAPVILSDGSEKLLRKHVEVWFMGCHSDVGGGNDRNDDPSLSNIPFR